MCVSTKGTISKKGRATTVLGSYPALWRDSYNTYFSYRRGDNRYANQEHIDNMVWPFTAIFGEYFGRYKYISTLPPSFTYLGVVVCLLHR
jgi:hypothetical protein